MTTRRDFIKQTALLAAAISLPKEINFLFPEKQSVIIIGAGLSGLSAAYKLNSNGYDVKVLESRARTGGRVHSHTNETGLTVELGGEWIGASHERIQQLCKEFNLELLDNSLRTHLIYNGEYFPTGKWDFSAEWKNKLQVMFSDYLKLSETEKQKLDKMDWWRFLMNNGISERDMNIMEYLNSTDFGESIRYVSAYSAIEEYVESSPNNEMDFKIKGGNSKLIEALVQKVGMENILTNHTVDSVNYSGKEIEIKCKNGTSHICSKLICTAPVFAVNKIKWYPAFKAEKTEALNSLQYARINKNINYFSEKFWKDEAFDMVTDTFSHYFYHATKFQDNPGGALICYTIGDKADVMSKRAKEERKNLILDSLKPAFGDVSNFHTESINYYWGNDEHSMGAYANYDRGQFTTVMPILQASVKDKIFFAGEHIAEWQGFMEGAVNSGEEAAENIMK